MPRLGRLRWTDGQLVAGLGCWLGRPSTTSRRWPTGSGSRSTPTGCRVVPNPAHTGCRIVWAFGDPLATPFTRTVPDAGAGLPTCTGVPMGRTEDGRPVAARPRCVDPDRRLAPGSGKASLVWSLMFGLAPAVRAGLVEVHGIDLKGGMEFAMGRGLFTRYAQTGRRRRAAARGRRDADDRPAPPGSPATSRPHDVPTPAEPLVFVILSTSSPR